MLPSLCFNFCIYIFFYCNSTGVLTAQGNITGVNIINILSSLKEDFEEVLSTKGNQT